MSKNQFIYVHNFIIGFSIMSIEMLASRYLSPFFGSSSIVWANVIGVAMLGIAIGYYFGGKLADRNPTPRYYFSLSIFAAIVTSVLPFLLSLILTNKFILTSTVPEILSSFIVSILVFGIPITCISLAGPFAVKLLTINTNQDKIGKIAGLLSACNTIGGIFGIYLTTFLLVPYIGVNQTIWLASLIIVVSAASGLILFGNNSQAKLESIASVSMSLVAILTAVSLLSYGIGTQASNVIAQVESPYQQINVYADSNDNSRYLVFDAPNNYQTKYNPDSQFTDGYADNYGLLTSINNLANKNKLNVLILGYAGGSIGKSLYNFSNTKIHIDGVEIDEEVTKISLEYFGVSQSERDIYHKDARVFLANNTKKYDIVVIDAFSNIFIPYHLMTVEFFELVKNAMNDDSIMAANTITSDLSGELFNKYAATISSSFSNLKYSKEETSTNVTFLASNKDFKFEPNSEFPIDRYNQFVNNIQTYSRPSQPKVFTDNLSDLQNLMNLDYYNRLNK